ncbi:MAG: hypothetical protein WCJ02_08885 [bacterium]
MNPSGTRTNVDVNVLVEYFSFRIMLMPRIIIVLNIIVTILGLAALICLPVAMIYFAVTMGVDDRTELIRPCGAGFLGVLLGLVVCRLTFEYLILFFRINETLTEILWKNEGLPHEQVHSPNPEPLDESPSSQDELDEIELVPPQPVYVAPILPHLLPENEIRPGDIVFDCPFCGHNHAISPKGAGITVNCMKCGKSIIVPE